MKTLPHNTILEKAVLGSMLINPLCKPDVARVLTESDFYIEAHTLLFPVIVKYDSDIILLETELRKLDIIDKTGGVDYLSNLISGIATSAPVLKYAREIKNLSMRRKLITSAYQLAEGCHTSSKDLTETIHEHKTSIIDLESERETDFASTHDILHGVLADVEFRAKSKSNLVGISTGFELIDEYTQGFEPETLILIAARPSIGKTALAINIAENMAQNGHLVIFNSQEMSAKALTKRRLAKKSNVYLSRIRSGQMEGRQFDMLINAVDEIDSYGDGFIILDHPIYSKIETFTATVESMALKDKIGAVFIDYLQLMGSMRRQESKRLEIGYISRTLKGLAKIVKAPVIALSQLSRSVESRENKRPRLDDLRESGDLEQDADIVIMLYRESKESEILELAGLKGRDVGTWKGMLVYNRFIQRITPMEEMPRGIIR